MVGGGFNIGVRVKYERECVEVRGVGGVIRLRKISGV